MSVGDISRRLANRGIPGREISDIYHFAAIHYLPERHSAMVLIYIFIPYCLSNSGGLTVIYPCFSADIALF